MRKFTRGAAKFIASLVRRSLFGLLAATAIAVAPIPADRWPLAAGLQVPVSVIVLVCSLGKALYDTLFYDRYQP